MGKIKFSIRPSKIVCVFQVNFLPKRYERGLKQTTDLKKYTRLRWGPYMVQNLRKVGSRYCPHEILHRPPRVDILIRDVQA